MKKPLISVIIANYNYGQYITETINSCLNQTLQRNLYEVIVVDDGSTDNSLQELKKYNKHITIIQSNHIGLPGVCNLGIEKSKGKFFVRVDSDDIVTPDFLEKLHNKQIKKNFDLVVCNRKEFYADGTEKKVELDIKNIYSFLSVGILFNTKNVKRVGGYRKFFWEEHDLIIRYYELFKNIGFTSEYIYMYRKHGSSMCDNKNNIENGWKELLAYWGPTKLLEYGTDNELQTCIKNA